MHSSPASLNVWFFFAAAQICLEPLILIILFRRPGSALPITCLKVQSPLYGRMVRIPLGRSRNLSVGERAAFHSKRILTFFAKEKTVKQRVKLSTYYLVKNFQFVTWYDINPIQTERFCLLRQGGGWFLTHSPYNPYTIKAMTMDLGWFITPQKLAQNI